MTSAETVSLREAQFILGRPEADIARAIDRGEIDKLTEEVIESAPPKKRVRRRVLTGRRRRATVMGYQAPRMVKRKVRKLGRAELVYLALEQQLHADLTPAGRKRIYNAIKAAGDGVGKINVGPFVIETRETAQNIRARVRQLKSVRNGIVEGAGGEPLIKGVGVSVYLIAGLAKGQSTTEILEDYPGLKTRQVARAVAYAEAYPKKGRPYPSRSYKRMLADLAASGALDDEPEPSEPLTLDMLR